MGCKKVLIVEDEKPTAENLQLLLELEGFSVDLAYDLKTAKEKFLKYRYPLVVLDLLLPDGEGIELLNLVNPSLTKVVVLTAHGTVETAVKAVKMGAFDYLQKPITVKELIKVLKKAVQQLESSQSEEEDILSSLIGSSEAIKRLKEKIPLLAAEDKNILIRGEEGVGKSFIARLIHLLSPRREFPFVKVTVGGKDQFELERELFGSSLPGKEREGAFEKAQRGTLLLSGIENLPLPLQKKLAKVLETKSFTPLGDNAPKYLNVRIIATTSKNLYEMAQRGKFDENLLMRINEAELEIPPLRERREDIVPLFEHFLEEFAKESGVQKPIISDEVIEFLQTYDFPANVRELKNIAERLVLLYHGKVVNVSDLQLSPKEERENIFSIQNWREAKKSFEREYLKRKLVETGGDIKKVAKMINLDISNIYRKIKEYNLEEYLKKGSEKG